MATRNDADTVHVYPLGDVHEHVTEGYSCPCHPDVKFVEGGEIVVHHSWDLRELFEGDPRGNILQ